MPRYKLSIAYEGTRYYGWQKQPDAQTVEGTIEAGLKQILGETVDVVGQGRTDRGVHAEGQTAHMDVSELLNLKKVKYGLLGVLPRDIAVWNIEPVDEGFHARFHAQGRQYRYQIITRPLPLYRHMTHRVLKPFDYNLMYECARQVAEIKDFTNFAHVEPHQPNAHCHIELSSLEKQGNLITYRIRADRFLRWMVRRIVGSMLQVGLGKRKPQYFRDLMFSDDMDESGHAAPAHGLILEEVFYKK